MASFRIEAGSNSSYTYVGIQPPLSPEQMALVQDIPHQWIRTVGDKSMDPYQEPFHGQPYTEVGFDTFGTVSDHQTLHLAERIAETLRAEGHEVQVDHRVRLVGAGRFLFASKT